MDVLLTFLCHCCDTVKPFAMLSYGKDTTQANVHKCKIRTF